MDLQARKYKFIQKLFNVNEVLFEQLENVIKHEKEEYQEISATDKKTLDKRLKDYKNNPNDILDWKDVKSDW